MGDRLGIQVAVDILHFSTFLVAFGVKMKYFLYIIHHIISQKLFNRKKNWQPKVGSAGSRTVELRRGKRRRVLTYISTAEPPITVATIQQHFLVDHFRICS